nr:protein YggS [uncultured bacterium]
MDEAAPVESEARARLEEIQARLAIASERAGRDANEVILIGAGKTVPAIELKKFLEAGLKHCGENYVQEGIAKIAALRPLFPDVKWHLIGALQSNKAREAVENFDLIHSVDRTSLVDALDKAARAQNKVQEILLQVNLGDESSKSGCAANELGTLFALCKEKENLKVRGLMCLPPFDENPETRRPYFQQLRELRNELEGGPAQEAPMELSMGMSNDFEIAIEEGATMVRVGTLLFGERDKKF